MPQKFRVALVGNPNAGKSTIFNSLTGERQHVGNWPGKTIEVKEGLFTVNDATLRIIDLPGTYSLTAYSTEETITRDFLIQDHPDVVIAVVDAANLQRNLYLVVQLIELGALVVVALNMTDIAGARGFQIDVEGLSARLGVPVVPTVATQGGGLEDLKTCIWDMIHQNAQARGE